MVDQIPSPKSTSRQQTVSSPTPKKRRRWFRRFFLLALVVGSLGWCAPLIIAKTELRNQIAKMVFPKFQGAIRLGETSLSWNSTLEIKDLRIEDDKGQVLLVVSRCSSSQPLWKMVTQPENLGTFKIVDPVVHVSFTDDDSNLERFVEQTIGQLHSGGTPAGYQLEVENARIELVHVPSNRQSTISPVHLRLASAQGAIQDVDLAIGEAPTTDHDSAATDWLVVRYGDESTSDAEPGANLAKMNSATGKRGVLRASKWKLDRLEPVLARFASKGRLTGDLNADTSLGVVSSNDTLDWDWTGTVSISQLSVSGIEALNRDQLQLKQVELSGQAATAKGRLAMHQVNLMTDVGQITATGDIPLNSQSTKSSMELIQSLLSDEDYHIDCRLNLKELARQLPQTLRIRDGIEITDGDVQIQFVGVADSGVRRWSGISRVQGLVANKNGQDISWTHPLMAKFNAHRDQQTIVVDLLDCNSDFLQVSGKGTLDDARFTATGNLAQLLQNIERFVDLGIQDMSGQMKASGEIRRGKSDQIEITTKMALDRFQYVLSNQNIWLESHLDLTVVAIGQLDERQSLRTLKSCEIHLVSGSDSLDVMLDQPVELTSARPAVSGKATLKGAIGNWQNRLRPFVAVDTWRLTGGVDASIDFASHADQIQLRQLEVDLLRFEAEGPEWLVQDPKVKLTTAGQWDRSTRRLTSPKVDLKGESVSMELTSLDLQMGNQGIANLSGNATYRADLERVSSWKNLAIKNPSCYLVGSLTGTASINRQNSIMNGNFDAQVERMVVAGPGIDANGQSQWVALWKEPNLKLNGKGSFDTANDTLKLESSQIEVDGLAVNAAGTLDQCTTTRVIDLTGQLAYDWDLLMKRFGSQLGQNIQLTGRDQRPFSLKGSLASATTTGPPGQIPAAPVSFQPGSSPSNIDGALPASGLLDLSGQAGIGWSTANIYGIALGAADLSTQIERGVCRFQPLDIVVNDGKLHLTPTIYLDRQPPMLVLPQERFIDQVSLSADLCRNSLRLVMPLLADATQVDGKISIDIQSAALPLTAPSTGTAQGVLSVHRAQARPGPAALQIIGAIDQIQSIITRRLANDPNRDRVWIELSEQQVPIRLEQGRVYHQNLTFMVKNVSVRTSGSVGVDNTLSLTAEIPVRDEWIGSNKSLSGLKGKSIRVPIVGTVSRPQIDPRVFSELAQQMGGAALDGLLQDKVGGELNDVINNGLDKLLRGKK